MPSDAAILLGNDAPGLTWEYQGQQYHLAAADLRDELFLQTEHEAWATNRLEAVRGKISPEAYDRRARRLEEMVASNRFAFGDSLSLLWLCSDEGMQEWIFLLLQKGASQVNGSAARRRPSRELLEGCRRSDPAAWKALVERVLKRDFPQLAPAQGSLSGAAGTQPPSTSASVSCSPALAGAGRENVS